MGLTSLIRARDRLLRAGSQPASLEDLYRTILAAFHDVATFQFATVLATDPETMMPAGGVVEGFEEAMCVPFWDSELLDPDVNKFTELARSPDPVATLAEALDGDLARSPRYRKLYAPLGATDELRAVFVAGRSCLAVGDFVRCGGEFSTEELADVRQLVPVVTSVLRQALGRVNEQAVGEPVMVILDAAGNIVGTTPGARRILEELATDKDVDGALPTFVRAAAVMAGAHDGATLTTRLRAGNRWLRLHVAPIEGDAGAVTLLFEPARPDDLIRILLESYGLTHRETEVVGLLARGFSLKEVAAELVISVHTARDHVKAIYEKTGVNSRGELLARLFFTHGIDRLHEPVVRVDGHQAPSSAPATSPARTRGI